MINKDFKNISTKPAVGAIGMLISLLIISIIFIMMMPMIKDIGSSIGGAGQSSIDTKSVEKQVDEQVNEIMKYRNQVNSINRNINQDE